MADKKFNLVPVELHEIALELGEDTLRDDIVGAYISIASCSMTERQLFVAMVRDLAKERARLIQLATQSASSEQGYARCGCPEVYTVAGRAGIAHAPGCLDSVDGGLEVDEES